MGLITSRFNLDSLHSNGRRRSQQNEEQLYSYSLNKNYFSNYFFMGGERFEVSDPDYIFGDSCDLNFLTCTKPYSLPYKKAQQYLLTNLNTKHKAINKVSSRVGSLSSSLNILRGRHRQVSQSQKQDAQTQTLTSNKTVASGPEPSQPLVMLVNIRKETLRLVKSPHASNLDSDQNSLTNTPSEQSAHQQPSHSQAHRHPHTRVRRANSTNRHSTTSSHATTIHPQDLGDGIGAGGEDIEMEPTVYRLRNCHDSDTSSITSNTLSSSQSTTASTSTSKSGYTSVRDVPPSECASDDGEYFVDALNEPTQLSTTDNDSGKNQHKSLLRAPTESTRETCDIKITIESDDEVNRHWACDNEQRGAPQASDRGESCLNSSNGVRTTSSRILTNSSKKSPKTGNDKTHLTNEQQTSNRVYNIEFTFDAEVDCSIRVSYFCTRVVSSNAITYKPLHATYKSKTYTYKRGLNQKFEQQEHSFRPYLFDEELLIYKPLDLEGNYNSGAVFPIVIHCVALEGPMPRQSQLLVATVEKSQLDDSYSIKPLKQMIVVDGVQYILQDIYGIENKPLTSSQAAPRRTPRPNRNLRSSCGSLHSMSMNLRNSIMNLSDDTSSICGTAIDNGDGASFCDPSNGGANSLVSNQYRSLASENTFECVICMSEERDTMLLPCRHMCLCSSCAQSLRYQSSACPICRCPFKAALNIRFARRNAGARHNLRQRSSADLIDEAENKCSTGAPSAAVAIAGSCNSNNKSGREPAGSRRESLTNSSTPLLARPKLDESEKGKGPNKKKTQELSDESLGAGRVKRTASEPIEMHVSQASSTTMEAADKAAATPSLETTLVGVNSASCRSGASGGNKGGASAVAEDPAGLLGTDDDGDDATPHSRALQQDSGNKCAGSTQEKS